MFYPQEGDIDQLIVEQFTRMRKMGEHVVLVDGAFDVPHPSHHWYLRHCKMEGAYDYSAKYGLDEPTPVDVRNILAQDRIRLAVTVDSDHRVAAKKGGVGAKGGVDRPIYPWQARAEQLLNYHFNDEHGVPHPVVDLTTVERDTMHEGTALETSLTLARFLGERGLLDTMVIYGEHQETVDLAVDMGITPVVVPPQLGYAINPQDGEEWHSSTIIKRAQGKAHSAVRHVHP